MGETFVILISFHVVTTVHKKGRWRCISGPNFKSLGLVALEILGRGGVDTPQIPQDASSIKNKKMLDRLKDL